MYAQGLHKVWIKLHLQEDRKTCRCHAYCTSAAKRRSSSQSSGLQFGVMCQHVSSEALVPSCKLLVWLWFWLICYSLDRCYVKPSFLCLILVLFTLQTSGKNVEIVNDTLVNEKCAAIKDVAFDDPTKVTRTWWEYRTWENSCNKSNTNLMGVPYLGKCMQQKSWHLICLESLLWLES